MMRETLQDILSMDPNVEIKRVKEDKWGDKTYSKVSKEQFAESAHIANKASVVATETKDLNNDEKLEWIEAKKARANQLLKDGKYNESSEVYLEALCAFSFEDMPKSRLMEISHSIKVPILNNLVLLLMK